MTETNHDGIARTIGPIPYRMALAGGWIDQPFVSRHNPAPPGSMVVVGLNPSSCYMLRAGMATGTREVALALWPGGLPDGDPADLVRELYREENKDRADPSGSQDMIGLVYPGINRLDYDFAHEGGVFPKHIESTADPAVAAWLAGVIHVLPIAPRPDRYSPLGVQRPEPDWIARLGQTGRDCYDAILHRDLDALGASMNECMRCWESILPHTVRHPALTVDLPGLLDHYQQRYPGAMYSGCGGGYLYVASDTPVPGAFTVDIRLS
ncbi:MAG: hypothetical protein JXR94_05625 [Candidatus Hydrogenedentes bacterium]|nr:hypothetical protein [Candidatus Hydrogenedentota bacterium]